MQCSIPIQPSPSSSQLAQSETNPSLFNDVIMASKSGTNVDNAGNLTYQRAVDIARNTEGDLDPSVQSYLDGALNEIWNRINLQPDSYILTSDEFAVFNFFRLRFQGNSVAEQAVARYWRNIEEPRSAQR